MDVPYKLLCGLEPLRVSEFEIQLQRGVAATSTWGANHLIEFPTAYTLDLRIFGKGGRDYAGSLVTGWHYIWLLFNATTGESSAIMSMSELGGGVTLPAGTTHIRKLNSFAFYYTTSTSEIQRYVFINWPNPTIFNTECDNATPYRGLLNGTATAWTEVTLGGNLMAPSARIARLHAVVEYDSASGSAYVRTPGLGNGLIIGTVTPYMTKQRQAFVELAVSSDLKIEYKVTAGVKLSLFVQAYSIQETY